MKNPLKKKKHRFRNFMCYFATYIAVTFCMAFVMVATANTTFSNTPPIISTEEETTLNKVIGNLMSLEDTSLKLGLTANNNGTALSFDGNIDLKVYSGFSNVDVGIDGDIIYNGMTINVALTYKDGYIYVSLNDDNYIIHTTSFLNGIVGTLALCGVDLGTASDLMSNFDMSMLDGLEESITEEVTDDGIVMTLALSDAIQVVIDVDNDYNIKNISLGDTVLGGFNIGAEVGFESINSGLNVEKKPADYVDVTAISDVMEACVNTFKNKKFDIDVDVNDFTTNIKFDRSQDIRAKLSTTLANNDMVVNYIDDDVYVDYSILKLKTSNVSESIKFIIGLVGDNLPSMDDALGDIDVEQLLGLVKNIKLQDITVDDNITTIDVGGYSINLEIADKCLKGLEFNVNGTSVVVRISTDCDFEITTSGEYIDVENFAILVEPIKNIVTEKAFSGQLTLQAGDVEIVSDIKADFNDGVRVDLKSDVYNVPVDVKIINNQLYVSVFDVNYVAKFDTIVGLAKDVLAGLNIGDVQLPSVVLDGVIKMLEYSSNGFILNYNDFNFEILLNNDNFSRLVVSGEDFELGLDLNVEKPTFDVVDDSKYNTFDYSLDDIKQLVNNLIKKQYSYGGTIEINGETIDIALRLDITNSLLCDVTIGYKDYALNLHIEDEVYYVDFDGIKIKGDFSGVKDIVATISKLLEYVDVELPNVAGLSNIEMPNITLQKIKLNGKTLEIAFNDVEIDLTIDNYNLAGIKVTANDLKIELASNDWQDIAFTSTQKKEYLADVNQLLDIAERIVNVKNQPYIEANVVFNTPSFSGSVKLNYEKNTNVLEFSTTIMDIDIVGYIYDGKLQLNLMDVCFEVKFEDIDIEKLSEVFGIERGELSDVMTVMTGAMGSVSLDEFSTSSTDMRMVVNGVEIVINAFDEVLNSVFVVGDDWDVALVMKYPNYNKININNNKIIRLDNFTDVLSAFYNTFKYKTLSGTINMAFPFGNEINNLMLNYGIKFDGGIKAYINTTFKGLEVNIYVVNDTIYLDILDMKIKVQLSEINDIFGWINDTFGDYMPDLDKFKDTTLSDISLDFIDNVSITSNSLKATLFNSVNIVADYTDVFNEIYFGYGDIDLTLYCTSFSEWILDSIDDNEYLGYEVVTDKIESVLSLVETRAFAFDLSVDIYKNGVLDMDIDFDAMFDASSGIEMYASGTMDNAELIIAYQNEFVFVNYDGLKLAINKNNLNEILGIVMSAMGLTKGESDLDMGNLQEIIPQVVLGNPLNMLGYISGLEITDNSLSVVIKESIFDSSSASDFRVTIDFDGTGIEKIYINDLHANGNVVNVVLTVKEFGGVTEITDASSYIDISNSSDLIRAFVSTSALNDFHIVGKAKVSGTIFGVEIVDKRVDIDVRVKLVDKKPVVSVAITNIPVIVFVNRDGLPTFATSNDDRALYLYYKDGYFYIYRHETYSGSKTYEKKLKLSTAEFFSDPLEYILGYGLGFEDKIMKEIKESLLLSSNRPTPIDMGNVLLGYKQEDDGSHTVTINLQEIAYNDMLGTADINLSTTKVDGKQYMFSMKFAMDMPLTNNIKLYIETDNSSGDLILTDIGSPVDIMGALQYIESYTYGANQKYVATNGEWKKSDEVIYTITFESNCDQSVSPIQGCEGDAVTIPSLTDYETDDGVVRKQYYFAGWFKESECVNAWAGSTIPRGDTTLYAKWNVVTTYYRTITFNSLGGKSLPSITALAGSGVSIPTLAIKQEVEESLTKTYTFLGWYLDENCTKLFNSSTMPNEDVTLYAKWSDPTIEYTRRLTVYDNNQVVGTIYIKAGEIIEFKDIDEIKSTTRYYADANYLTEITDLTMPDHDLDIHIRNYYNVEIRSEYGTVVAIIGTYLQGEGFSIPTQNSFYTDDGTQTLRVDYTFNGYKVNGVIEDVAGTFVSPNKDVVIVADWQVTTKYYYTVTLDTKTTGLESTADKGVTVYEDFKVLEGETIDLSVYQPTCVYKWGIWYHCNFKGWQYDGNTVTSVVMPAQNITIKAKWSTPLGGKD